MQTGDCGTAELHIGSFWREQLNLTRGREIIETYLWQMGSCSSIFSENMIKIDKDSESEDGDQNRRV